MSQHEKTAWWGLGSGILIWLFLLVTTLFLADAVKQAAVLWQYRR